MPASPRTRWWSARAELCLKSSLLHPSPLQPWNATTHWHFGKKKLPPETEHPHPLASFSSPFFNSLRNGALQRLYLDSTVRSSGSLLLLLLPLQRAQRLPGGGGPPARLDAVLSLRVSLLVAGCRCSAAITFVCLLSVSTSGWLASGRQWSAGRGLAMETRTRAGTGKEPRCLPPGRQPPTSSRKRRGRGLWLCTTPFLSGRTVSPSTDPCSSSEKITLSGNMPRSSSIGHILSCPP